MTAAPSRGLGGEDRQEGTRTGSRAGVSGLPRADVLALVVMAVSVLAGIGLGWAALGAPGVVPAQASATVFSAERAMVDLRAIAAEGRPTGSPANTAHSRTHFHRASSDGP